VPNTEMGTDMLSKTDILNIKPQDITLGGYI